nr:LCP family protein [Propionicimonas sp.]
MESDTGTRTTTRRLVDRVAICLLLGVVVASVGGAALLTVYLNRVGDAVAGLQRSDPLPTYPGRPSAVGIDGVSPVNYLLMTTRADGTLDAVLIAHLSASRRDLILIALPADLLVADGVSQSTLAASFREDPLVMARAVEALTDARMDHQVRLDLDAFAGVVDTLGGIDLAGGRLDGDEVLAHLTAAPDPLSRSLRTADLLRAALSRANLGVAIADPNRFDKVMDALTPCLVVDTDLTSEEIRSTMVESRVRADEVVTWPLTATPAPSGAAPDPVGLADLRSALASDVMPSPAVVPTASPASQSLRGVPATPVTAEPTTTEPRPAPTVASHSSSPRVESTPTPSVTR